MRIKEHAKRKLEYSIAKVARKSAVEGANTVCTFWGYQPKVPKQIKTLRKF